MIVALEEALTARGGLLFRLPLLAAIAWVLACAPAEEVAAPAPRPADREPPDEAGEGSAGRPAEADRMADDAAPAPLAVAAPVPAEAPGPEPSEPAGGEIEPPQLVHGSRQPAQLLQLMASGDYAWGVCVFSVVIDAGGRIGQLEFLKPERLAPEVRQAIGDWAQGLRYRPATQDGRPVELTQTLTIHHCPHWRREPAAGLRACGGTLGFGGLVEDLRRYRTTNDRVHAGDLYEHSVWAAKAVQEWFDEGAVWTEGLDDGDRCLAVVAAFLHDIGKAGDGETRFRVKRGHAAPGSRYVLDQQDYLLDGGGDFDFAGWFEQLGLGEVERRRVAFLVAVHRALGEEILEVVEDPEGCSDLEARYPGRVDAYLERLRTEWTRLAPAGGELDDRLVRLAVLVTAADVRAMQPVRHPSSLFAAELPDDLEAPHEGGDRFHDWAYPTEGILVRDCVLRRRAESLRTGSGAGRR